ncbi:hypothetical protein JXJ21_03520 [candidate division KSB1 bacterium]|nr:hypothetical protein [candidate division KSB1 bacterium]
MNRDNGNSYYFEEVVLEVNEYRVWHGDKKSIFAQKHLKRCSSCKEL